MAYALRALGKDVARRQRGPGAAAADGVPRRAGHRDRRPRSTATSTPRSSWSAATWRAPASPGLDRFFVINIDHHPGNTGYGQINWFDADGRRLRRDGVRPRQRARRAADARDRDAHLPGDPDRHRLVPLLEHLAADVRHLPRRLLEAGVDPVRVARSVYDSNNMGRLKLFGAVLSAMQLDPTGRIAIALSRSRDGARRRRHLRRHRGPDQPAADGEGDPGRRLLQAGRGRRVPREHAVEGRRRHRRHREGVRRRRPQERRRLHGRPAPSTRCRRLFVEKDRAAADRMDGLLVIDKPAGPTSHDVVARVRRVLGERRIGHTGTLDPAASGVLPLVLGRATRLARFLSAERQGVRGGRSASASRPTPYDARGHAGRRARRRAAARRATRSSARSTRSAARSCSSRRRTRRRRSTATRSYTLARAQRAAGCRPRTGRPARPARACRCPPP